MPDPRPDANLIEKVTAVKLAIASADLAGPFAAMRIIQWLLDGEEPEVSRGTVPTRLFIAGIKATQEKAKVASDETERP